MNLLIINLTYYSYSITMRVNLKDYNTSAILSLDDIKNFDYTHKETYNYYGGLNMRITLLLYILVSFFNFSYSESVDVQILKDIILSKLDEQKGIRKIISYNFYGEFIIPEDTFVEHEKENKKLTAETGKRQFAYENHYFQGKYCSINDFKRLEIKIYAKKDNALLEDKVFSTDGIIFQEGDFISNELFDIREKQWIENPLNVENDLLNFRAHDGLDDFVQDKKNNCRFDISDLGHKCLVISSSWEIDDPTTTTKNNKIKNSWEFWFDSEIGYLPYTITSGPAFYNGKLLSEKKYTKYFYKEINGRLLLTGFESYIKPIIYKNQLSKYTISIDNVKLNDEVIPPQSWFPDKTGMIVYKSSSSNKK